MLVAMLQGAHVLLAFNTLRYAHPHAPHPQKFQGLLLACRRQSGGCACIPKTKLVCLFHATRTQVQHPLTHAGIRPGCAVSCVDDAPVDIRDVSWSNVQRAASFSSIIIQKLVRSDGPLWSVGERPVPSCGNKIIYLILVTLAQYLPLLVWDPAVLSHDGAQSIKQRNTPCMHMQRVAL